MSATKQKAAASDVIDAIAKQVNDKIDAQSAVKADNGKKRMVNKDGKILKCEITLVRKKDAPDPLCVTINEEFYWLKRGSAAIVPWYFVVHMLRNIERQYRQEVVDGKKIVIGEDVQAEGFNYREIDLGDNPTVAEYMKNQTPVAVDEE